MDKIKIATERDLEEYLRSCSEVELTEFREFARELFCDENLTFWIEIENFRRLEQAQLYPRAIEIYDKYLRSGSGNEINVSERAKGVVREAINQKQVTSDCFNPLQKEVARLIAMDTLERWFNSPRYKNIQESSSAGFGLRRTESFEVYNDFLQSTKAKRNSGSEQKWVLKKSPLSNSMPELEQEEHASLTQMLTTRLFSSDPDLSGQLTNFKKSDRKKRVSGSDFQMQISQPQLVRTGADGNQSSEGEAQGTNGNSFKLTLQLGDFLHSTRVSGNLSCGELLTREMKKIESNNKKYGIFLHKAQVWLEEAKQLQDYSDLLTSSEILIVKPRD